MEIISAYWQELFTVEHAQSVGYFRLGNDDLAGERAASKGKFEHSDRIAEE